MEFSSSAYLPEDPLDQEGVELLLGIATIVSKEIANNSNKQIFDDEGDNDHFYTRSERSIGQPSYIFDDSPTPRSTSSVIKDDTSMFAWHRVRTVSIDNGEGSPKRFITDLDDEKPIGLRVKSSKHPAIVSPTCKRGSRRKPNLKILAIKGKKKQVKVRKPTPTQSDQTLPNIMSDHSNKATKQRVINGKSITMIHRKKFSWKNYHELEAFLVANREEYLRHSALNYTTQQKKYNNRLTERLLDLAAKHLYVFNEEEFSFVTVRDRIRCFYKSYVQSSKKRGLILGYAARKAGILSPADLQRSARKEGTIVTPVEL